MRVWALSYEVLGIQKHPHAHAVDEFQCVFQLKAACMWLCLYFSITALGHMGGAAYSISAAGSATELGSESALLTKPGRELIAESNPAQEDQQRVRDHVILLGSIYHLCKSTACLLSATSILPNTAAPPLCCASEPLCLCSRLPRAQGSSGPAVLAEGRAAVVHSGLIYEETFCGCGRWRPIRPWARVSPGVFVFRGARWCFSMGLMKSSSAPNAQAMRWALKARLSRLSFICSHLLFQDCIGVDKCAVHILYELRLKASLKWV